MGGVTHLAPHYLITKSNNVKKLLYNKDIITRSKSGIIILAALLSCVINLSAKNQAGSLTTSDTLQVLFRQNKIVLDPQFRNNGANLAEFSQRFNLLASDSLNNVRSLMVVSGASPEGSLARNRFLSDNRARVVCEYLLKNNNIDTAMIELDSRGIDWKGLSERVSASDLPNKKEILDILAQPECTIINGKTVESRKKSLKKLDGGRTWHTLYNRYFAELRGTRVMISYNRPRKPQVPLPLPHLDSLFLPTPQASAPSQIASPLSLPTEISPFYMAIKTNLLYDALLVPNIGIEFYLGNNKSLAANWMYAWWKSDRVHNYWRIYGGDIELRHWIGNKPLRGHHFGIYGQILTYDFELGGRGYLADKWSYAVGLSYGYSMPLSRRLNLDFSIGIGFLHGKYKEYLPLDGHYVWQSTRMHNSIYPTKLEVSLAWMLGRGNTNTKGGSK